MNKKIKYLVLVLLGIVMIACFLFNVKLVRRDPKLDCFTPVNQMFVSDYFIGRLYKVERTAGKKNTYSFYIVTDDAKNVKMNACKYFRYPQAISEGYLLCERSNKYANEYEISQYWISQYNFREGGDGDIVLKKAGDSYFTVSNRRVYVVDNSRCIFTY